MSCNYLHMPPRFATGDCYCFSYEYCWSLSFNFQLLPTYLPSIVQCCTANQSNRWRTVCFCSSSLWTFVVWIMLEIYKMSQHTVAGIAPHPQPSGFATHNAGEVVWTRQSCTIKTACFVENKNMIRQLLCVYFASLRATNISVWGRVVDVTWFKSNIVHIPLLGQCCFFNMSVSCLWFCFLFKKGFFYSVQSVKFPFSVPPSKYTVTLLVLSHKKFIS